MRHLFWLKLDLCDLLGLFLWWWCLGHTLATILLLPLARVAHANQMARVIWLHRRLLVRLLLRDLLRLTKVVDQLLLGLGVVLVNVAVGVSIGWYVPSRLPRAGIHYVLAMGMEGVDGALVEIAGAGGGGGGGGVVDEEDDGGDDRESQEAYSAGGRHFGCDEDELDGR